MVKAGKEFEGVHLEKKLFVREIWYGSDITILICDAQLQRRLCWEGRVELSGQCDLGNKIKAD